MKKGIGLVLILGTVFGAFYFGFTNADAENVAKAIDYALTYLKLLAVVCAVAFVTLNSGIKTVLQNLLHLAGFDVGNLKDYDYQTLNMANDILAKATKDYFETTYNGITISTAELIREAYGYYREGHELQCIEYEVLETSDVRSNEYAYCREIFVYGKKYLIVSDSKHLITNQVEKLLLAGFLNIVFTR